ncbi:diguanylate cyclase [Vulgatibacter incomptus]|uniref:diguanylate cyclase n=1 Tax=Vulgatibacter incomptus TaxID=1391653 RepID=A0A0K1PC16_9BACT|nr:diguanylate cyclase [Vulgatibacter incomptus]AKU91078.1 hypothetical protein AKJ08_1465 [Vulgatibacter incomptus]
MKTGLRKAARIVAAGWPLAVGAVALAAVILRSFESLDALSLGHAAILVALAIGISALGFRKLRKGAEQRPLAAWNEAELGALLVIGAHALIQPVGGLGGPLYPVIYLLIAFLAAFLPFGPALGLAVFAIAVDAAALAAAGALRSSFASLLVHGLFLALFAMLSRLVNRSQVASARATGRLALDAALEEQADRARAYRLRIAGVKGQLNEEEWIAAAVSEVSEAVDNALEVAECALRPHSVAVFLLHGDDNLLKLHEARASGAPLRLEAFDAREGLVGAALRRRVPMRLCGDLKGVGWYEGKAPVHSVLFAPLIDRRGAKDAGRDDGYLRGLVIADRLEPIPFTQEDERLLVATSREVLRAMETERVMGYIRSSREEIDRFYGSIEKLNGASKPVEVIDTSLRVVKEIRELDLDLVAFTTSDFDSESGKRLHRVERIERAERPERGDAEKEWSSKGLEDLLGYQFADNGHLVASSVRVSAVLPPRNPKLLERVHLFDEGSQFRGLQSLKVIPLRAADSVLGTIVCGSKRRKNVDLEWTRMLEVIGMQAAQSLERARLFEKTEKMATSDGLTGLANHRHFQGRFDDEVVRSQRAGRKLTLILADIDHFKAVNDTYGHATGDMVLRGIAKAIQRCARATDTVARYGGEEFALLLPETDLAGGKEVAERIRKEVGAIEFQTALGPLRCTLSLGIASYPDTSTVKQEIFEAADQCLYHCKRMGRNRSTAADELSVEARKKAAAESS